MPCINTERQHNMQFYYFKARFL